MARDSIHSIIGAICRCAPPNTNVRYNIHDISDDRVFIHGIHGSGKTTTSKMAIAIVPDYTYVDENYNAIKQLVYLGGDVTRTISEMFNRRDMPHCSIVDRSPIDNIAYAMASHMSNGGTYREAYNIMVDRYPSYIREYFNQNHIWLIPNTADVARQNVLKRNRPWDDSTESPYYDILHECYREISGLGVLLC